MKVININYSKVNESLRSKNEVFISLLEGKLLYDNANSLIKNSNDNVGKIMAKSKLKKYGFGEWEIEGLLNGENKYKN